MALDTLTSEILHVWELYQLLLDKMSIWAREGTITGPKSLKILQKCSPRPKLCSLEGN